MRALTLTTLSSTLALALCMNAGAAETAMSKAEYDDAKAKISTQFKTAKAACDAQQGNAKSICMEEAKGQEKVSMAELEYQREPSARHSQQLITANADAAYCRGKAEMRWHGRCQQGQLHEGCQDCAYAVPVGTQDDGKVFHQHP